MLTMTLFPRSILLGSSIVLVLNACMHDQNEQAIKSENAKSGESIYRVGLSLQKAGDYSTAMRMYKQALTLDPDYTDALTHLAQVARLNHQVVDTTLLLEKAYHRMPENSDIILELAKLYIAASRGEEAERLLRPLLTKEETNEWLNTMGLALDNQEKHEQARIYYQKILVTDPNHYGALTNIGLSLALQGSYDEALRYLEPLLRRDHPTVSDRHNVAFVYALTGRMEKARQLYRIDLDPVSTEKNLKFIERIKSQQTRIKPLIPAVGLASPLPQENRMLKGQRAGVAPISESSIRDQEFKGEEASSLQHAVPYESSTKPSPHQENELQEYEMNPVPTEAYEPTSLIEGL